jgi:very-short-patch-repair endonuclease
LVTRQQLRSLGVTDSSLARAVQAGHLHPSFRGVFGVGRPPTGERTRMSAAVLACGQWAVVSHRTAAALLGLLDRAPVVIDVIAAGESGRGIDGIRRHHVPPPDEGEIGTYEGIPCTGPSRTIVDLAGMLGEHTLRRLVERAAVHQRLDLPAIDRSLAAHRRRGAPALRAILRDWRKLGADEQTTNVSRVPLRLRSELEARLFALIGASDLPAPTCNRKIKGDGESVEVDFLWPEQRLVVETDGRRFHHNPIAFERDRARDRALQLSGYRVVRFTHAQIDTEPAGVVAAIRRLLTNDFR